MNGSKTALFLSGLFFGGAIDHLILVTKGSDKTPYGISVGVKGNLGLAVFDGIVAFLLYLAHQRFGWQPTASPK